MDDFILRALIGGLGVACICGPLGCVVVWQRMAYFGAALAHAALLGIALGLFLQINLQLAILLVSLAVSALLLTGNRTISDDTLLGILAHGALAFGLVLLGVLPGVRVDLLGYLFGDLLAVTATDIIWIYVGGAGVLLALACIWRRLLSLIVQRELALVDGISETRMRAIFLLLLSLVVAVSMQVIGILLIVSLLIIPAATARYFVRSPEGMAMLATAVGCIAVAGGLALSLWIDSPAGPSIVVVASALFAVAAGVRR